MPQPFSAAPPRFPSAPARYDPEEQAQFRQELEQTIRATKEHNEYVALYGEMYDVGGVVFNVKHPKFGAVGDGVTDDAAAIQAALDALPASGGTVYFPLGIYMVGTKIEIKKPGVRLV